MDTDQFDLPLADPVAKFRARQAVARECVGLDRARLQALIRRAYIEQGAATPSMTQELVLTEGRRLRSKLHLLAQIWAAIVHLRLAPRRPEPMWLTPPRSAVTLAPDGTERWVTLDWFPGLDTWAGQVVKDAPYHWGSVVFLRAWAQREHHFGEQQDRWTVRVGQQVMGHVPLAGPALLAPRQTGQPIKVSATLLPRSERGRAVLEVKLPALAPLSDGAEARDWPG